MEKLFIVYVMPTANKKKLLVVFDLATHYKQRCFTVCSFEKCHSKNHKNNWAASWFYYSHNLLNDTFSSFLKV